MKSQLLSALAVVGVIGTATTAYAANIETLAGLDNQLSPTSAEPTVVETIPTTPFQEVVPTPSGEPTQAPTNELDKGVAAIPPQQRSFSVVPAPAVAPAIQVDGTTGGSGTSVDYDDDHDEDDHDEDDHDEDDHDD